MIHLSRITDLEDSFHVGHPPTANVLILKKF